MASDARIKTFKLEFPLRKPSTGLKPMRTYHGRVKVEVTQPISINQLRIQFEGWERIDFGSKIGATRKMIFRSSDDLLQGGGVVIDTIARDAVFDFACTMPNINFPSAMQSAICEIAYTVTASLVGDSRPASISAESQNTNKPNRPASSCANHIVTLATESMRVQLTPKVLPSGVGWLKPLVMRDGVMLTEPVRRRFRRHHVQTAMNICVQVRNHCCTLGEAIAVDVDATMLQKDRVLTFLRAAVIEQVALKTQVDDVQALQSINAFIDGQGGTQASTVLLAERTLNRKVSEIDPSALSGVSAKDWGTSGSSQPLLGLDGVQNLQIRVPRRDVCTSEGFFLKFSHVLRLTFGLTSRPSNGRFDTKYATKDIPLRLVTSKFGDVGRMSQVEINRRLSALTTESDGTMVSEAYGYLLSENSRAVRPTPLESFAGNREIPAPSIVSVMDPMSQSFVTNERPISSGVYSNMSAASPDRSTFCPDSSQSCLDAKRTSLVPSAVPTQKTDQLPVQTLVDSTGFESRPLPPLPKASFSEIASAESTSKQHDAEVTGQHSDAHLEEDNDDDDSDVLFMANQQSSSKSSACSREQNRDTLVDIPAESVCTGTSDDLEESPKSTLTSAYSSSASLAASYVSQDAASSDIEPTSATKYARKQQLASTSMPLMKPVAFVKCQGTQAPSKLTINEKRGSAQSEGETIVSSPRSDHFDDEEPHSVFNQCSFEPKHAKAKMPELPALPVMESLGEMTKGLLEGSSVFGDESLSSFMAGRGF
ncbi:hypothetical protein IWW36_000056 [Coemansia brasiliensis]|uniref:Arrestin-like N-terminal domain-containing protein n=1 Tax=Coemansia brasiliensis TaxID=2650707 RepID=A0A9W8IE68_9FUNG|nr:hypothetical protein IWW36_000056 [Coemansia brasiliensis]